MTGSVSIHLRGDHSSLKLINRKLLKKYFTKFSHSLEQANPERYPLSTTVDLTAFELNITIFDNVTLDKINEVIDLLSIDIGYHVNRELNYKQVKEITSRLSTILNKDVACIWGLVCLNDQYEDSYYNDFDTSFNIAFFTGNLTEEERNLIKLVT